MPKTYSTVPDKATGDVFTEAMWDTYIKDNVNNLIVPPACSVYKAAAQSIASLTETACQFDTEFYDTDSMHDNVTNNSRITIQTTGIYLLNAYVLWASNTTGYRFARFRVGGAAGTIIAQDILLAGAALGDMVNNLTVLRSLVAGDYVEVYVQQSSGGGALNASVQAQAHWMGRTS